MRICRYIAFVVLATLLQACQVHQMPEDIPETPETPELVEHTLYASTPGEEDPATRTVLDSGNDRKILWSAGGESISILPSAGGNYEFTGDNVEAASSAAFTGSGPGALGSYVALYPYNSSASYDGTSVSTTLPASQTGKAGSFADGYLITADDATGNHISFNHVCSGLRFQVSRDDIKSVTIRGNNGEKIAGDFCFSFPSEDTPVAQDATEEYVTLTALGGGCFETGEYYYIVVLPTTFTKGFTLTADYGKQVGELRFNSSVTFTAGTFKNITGNLNERMSTQVYYGPQNTFCLRPDENCSIDVQPRIISGAWQRSGVAATGAGTPASVDVLWGSATASLSGTTLTMSSASEGSSLVAIKDAGENILWSFLLWVTESAPAETTLPGGAVVLPPLGGGLYFQWGRKDPLLSTATRVDNQGTGGLSYAIAHPDKYINGDHSTGKACDWFCQNKGDQDPTLWGDGGLKTVWDPCPQGYRVPSEADYTHKNLDYGYLKDAENNFAVLGYISSISGFYPYCRTYWTRKVHDEYAASLDDTDYVNEIIFRNQTRDIAAPIRCVKE